MAFMQTAPDLECCRLRVGLSRSVLRVRLATDSTLLLTQSVAASECCQLRLRPTRSAVDAECGRLGEHSECC